MVQIQKESQEPEVGALVDEGNAATSKVVKTHQQPVVVDRTDPSFWSNGSRGSTEDEETIKKELAAARHETKTSKKQEFDIYSVCPRCDAIAVDIKCKLVCPQCHTIVQACCD